MTGFYVACPSFLSDPVMAIGDWRHNSVLIADIARMGRYLRWDMEVWDASYGQGAFWNHCMPRLLVGTDADPEKGAPDGVVDARFPPPEFLGRFDASIWDAPYKLNGQPSDPDRPYGVDVSNTRDGRHELMLDGLTGVISATKPEGYVLAKSMTQVNSGRKWWQPEMLRERAESLGCRKVDEFHFRGGYRRQPDRKVNCPACDGKGCGECAQSGKIVVPFVQGHAASNFSTLTVFQVPKNRPTQQIATLFDE